MEHRPIEQNPPPPTIIGLLKPINFALSTVEKEEDYLGSGILFDNKRNLKWKLEAVYENKYIDIALGESVLDDEISVDDKTSLTFGQSSRH